ncbi:hypothetical protein M758_UG136900 [Ceratodon purpureus]|nr:hypothetical protein M758_UG136900 [Ceratodon purpureus]
MDMKSSDKGECTGYEKFLCNNDKDSDDSERCWTKEELQEHFQFGPEYFGAPRPPWETEVEVNASVMASLLLICVGQRFGVQLLPCETLWDEVYALLLHALLS